MKKQLLIVSLILLLTACGKSGADPNPGGGNGGNQPTQPAPAKALLTFPEQNAVCITGTVISDTESSVTFTWNASDNTDSYDLNVKNLLSGVSDIHNTSQTQLSLNLLRNTPYSWHVVSKSAKTTATAETDTWKFYNAGKGTVTYAPFPAEITAPEFGQTVKTATVDLKWTGSAVDNGTIANYDVYLGTGNAPALLQGTITDGFLNGVAVTSGKTYYWKVVTRDIFGNTSQSELYQFNVKY